MKYYPTKIHEEAAKKFIDFFRRDKRVMAILLTCSCARRKAHGSSCIDFALVVKNWKHEKPLMKKFENFEKTCPEYKSLKKLDKFTHIDLDIIDGKFKPNYTSIISSASHFELELGNYVAYSVIVFERGKYFSKIKKKYLPYYGEELREERLKRSTWCCVNNLDHIESFVKRKLYFQAYGRLYDASQEFMQALFIKNKIYPIAYDKWVKDQYCELLKRPDLYKKIVKIISIKNLESDEIKVKAEKLRGLVKEELG